MEADFQQYYGIDLDATIKESFPRLSRLFTQLPGTSRVVTTINPLKDWDWDKETQSLSLNKLDQISVILANMFRGKGKPPAKVAEQWQPDYVKEAKEESRIRLAKTRRVSEEEMAAIKRFWKARNPEAIFIEE